MELTCKEKTSGHKQLQTPELPTVALTWHASKCNVHKLHQRYILKNMELIQLPFTLCTSLYRQLAGQINSLVQCEGNEEEEREKVWPGGKALGW